MVIRNGTALIGERLEPVELGQLILRKGAIAEIVPAGREIAAKGNEDVVDATGCYVLPGLVDAHVHLSLPGGSVPFETWEATSEERAATTIVNGLKALLNGITAIRDLGCPDTSVIHYRRLVEDRTTPGPRVAAAGRPIARPGGHIWEHCRVADGADEVRRAAQEQLQDGASVVKLMASGGFSSATDPSADGLSLQDMRAAVEVAHAEGVHVAAHAHSDQAVRNALEAEVDSIEHAAFATPETHARIRDAGATLVPTLHAVAAVAEDGDALTAERLERFRGSIRDAVREGVPIGAGTDAGTLHNPVGGLVDELLEYQAQGMSAHDAVRAATVVAGRLIGEGIGILEAEACADVIVVAGDPLRDLEALRDIRAVIVRGKQVDQSALINSLSVN